MTDDEGTHLSHCNQGEYLGSCKYGELDTCPSLIGDDDAKFQAWLNSRTAPEDLAHGIIARARVMGARVKCGKYTEKVLMQCIADEIHQIYGELEREH